jgi:hypothetical protein
MKMTMRGSGRGVAGALLTLLLTSAAFADGPAFSGYVESQYGYNFDKPLTGMTALRSYDAQDNNIANTAHIALTGSLDGGASYVVELDAGHDAATTFGAGTTSSDVGLQEAYLTWMSESTKLGVKAGKFVTFQGIEVIETNANPTISRGYLFGLAEPFTHVGGVLTYVCGKFDFAAGVVNGWDLPNDNNSGKTVVGKVGFNFGDAVTGTLSGYHGPEQAVVVDTITAAPSTLVDNRAGANRNSVDLTVVTKIIPKVDLWLQGNWGEENQVVDLDGDTISDDRGSWSGVGVQPVIHISDKFSIGARGEYFADPDGARTGVVDNFVTNFTITPGYMLSSNVQVRAEYRYDTSNKKIWVDDQGTAKDTASTAALQFIVTY